jgi:hypothetical protein
MKKKIYKKLCKEYLGFIDNAFGSATSALDLSSRVISKWGPWDRHGLPKSWRHGLSKKEVSAAFMGFAIGVANGADSVVRGMRIGDEDDAEVRDWLLATVASCLHKEPKAAHDDNDGSDGIDLDGATINDEALRGFIEMLFGTEDESE